MKLGNIIYSDDLVNHEKVEYINYAQGNNKPFSDLNLELPTLYVGWRFLKNNNPNDIVIQNQSILDNKVVTNLLYWEYSFKENKAQHVSGVDMFVNNVPFFYFSSRYNYYNIDPVFFQIRDLDDLSQILPKKIDGYYNYKGEMLYILKDKKIWGLDLNMYEYFEFDIEKLLLKITDHSAKIFTDLEGETYQEYYKTFPNFDNLKRYLIVLLTK